MSRLPIFIFILSLATLGSCSTNPVTGKSQFSLVSADQEVEIGSQNYLPYQQSQGGRYVVDPELSLYVSRVGNKIAKVSNRKGLPYEFVVLNNDIPNAWALPGGKIAINRGLLVHLKDESELAAVLAHEIVHAAARHGATQMTQGALLGLGAQVAGLAGQQTQYSDLINQGVHIGAGAVQARYGREQELEADEFGMVYMSKAGYNVKGAVSLQETFVQLSKNNKSNWLQGLFASHPPSEERVKANRAKVAQLPPGGVVSRLAYQVAIKQIMKDKPAYDKHQQALAAAQNKNYSKALALTKQAIQIQPRESHFWITKGQLLAQQDKHLSAATALDKSLSLNPDYYKPHLVRGLIRLDLKQYKAAEKDLANSYIRLPTQLASYELGKLAVRSGNTDTAREYFQEAVNGGGNLAEQAKQQLDKLGPAPTPSPNPNPNSSAGG